MTGFKEYKVDGVLWAPGVHRPHVDGEVSTVHVTEEDVRAAYPLFEQMARDGGIPVDVDHLYRDRGKEILHSLGYGDVARITGVELREDGIHATRLRAREDLFQGLIEGGVVEAFSPYMDVLMYRDPDGGYRVREVGELKSVSLVKTPGCPTCRIMRIESSGADDMRRASIMFYFGGGYMTEKEEIREGVQEEEPVAQAGAEAEANDDLLEKVKAMVDEAIGSLKEELQGMVQESIKATVESSSEPGGEDDDIRAELEAMKARLLEAEAKELVESYAGQGKILPRDLDKHMTLAMKARDEYVELMESAPVVVDMTRKSSPARKEAKPDKPSYQQFLDELQGYVGGE